MLRRALLARRAPGTHACCCSTSSSRCVAGVRAGCETAMGLIPGDAPEATLTTIVFFAVIYLAAKALIALDTQVQQ